MGNLRIVQPGDDDPNSNHGLVIAILGICFTGLIAGACLWAARYLLG